MWPLLGFRRLRPFLSKRYIYNLGGINNDYNRNEETDYGRIWTCS